jgi:hypothetical protein
VYKAELSTRFAYVNRVSAVTDEMPECQGPRCTMPFAGLV